MVVVHMEERIGLFEGMRRDRNEKVYGCYVCGLEQGMETHVIVNQTEEQKKTGTFTSHPVYPETVRQTKTVELQLDEARAQFLGFVLGKSGFDIIELVSGMGLRIEEWNIIRDDTGDLDKEQIKEIDEYFIGKGEEDPVKG